MSLTEYYHKQRKKTQKIVQKRLQIQKSEMQTVSVKITNHRLEWQGFIFLMELLPFLLVTTCWKKLGRKKKNLQRAIH